LPTAFEDAVRAVLQETRFSTPDPSDQPGASRVRVRASFESSVLAH
jgi:hypothetical protein